MGMATSSRRVGTTLLVSLAGVAAVTYAVAAAGSPFVGTLDAVGGVHMEAEYIEGDSVRLTPKLEAPGGCNDSMVLNFEGATVGGVVLYAEFPEPLSDGSTEAGFELDADEYSIGSVQLLVSEMNAEYEGGMSVSSFDSDDEEGLAMDGFRMENVTTRVYGFGSGWFDAPFVRTDYEPDAKTVEKYRC